jgi:tRNA threonylcarbamoyladenosine biosynthesis protein TsaB
MITLGIECSSRQGSLALLNDGTVLAATLWIADRVRHNRIFEELDSLVQEAGISYRDITLYAVGRGPGSFSGMRMSFAIAQALALPLKTEVRAVSSGAALALAVAREGAERVAVAGDARRGQIWFGVFEAGDAPEKLCQSAEWELIPYEEASVPEGAVIVSPEAERLTTIFPDLGEACFPHAKEVAELAILQQHPEPLEPLYMHPPVFVSPKI